MIFQHPSTNVRNGRLYRLASDNAYTCGGTHPQVETKSFRLMTCQSCTFTRCSVITVPKSPRHPCACLLNVSIAGRKQWSSCGSSSLNTNPTRGTGYILGEQEEEINATSYNSAGVHNSGAPTSTQVFNMNLLSRENTDRLPIVPKRTSLSPAKCTDGRTTGAKMNKMCKCQFMSRLS